MSPRVWGPEGDPTQFVDDWPLLGLSATDRTRIKSQLLKAHAYFHRTGLCNPAMQQAFGAIAGVLFDAKLLTVPLLENQLRLFVMECAITGNWFGISITEARVEIFPGYLGHLKWWEHVNLTSPLVFSAEIAEWKSKLLEALVLPEALSVATKSVGPKTLRADYFASFPDEKIKILDVCWAAGQHYREWKRWIAGEIKAASTADLAFRKILTSRKRPQEYKAKPRPTKWQ